MASADPSHPARSETIRLSESEERFQLLVQSVKDYAIFMLDPAGYITSWNAGAERIKGYTAQEIVGEHFSIFYPEAARERCTMRLEVATSEGRYEEHGWRLRKDGSRFWASVTITALRDTQGTLIGFGKVTRDLTAQREAEEETRRFKLLIESVKDYAIFILDPTGRVATWNPGAQRIKGYSAHEIIGKHFSIFYPPEVARAGQCEMELRVASAEGRFEEEGWRVRKDGKQFWANVTITALRDPEGMLVGFAKVTRDLTARREAEEKERSLAAQKAALAEKVRLQQFQERFLAILGHDLRNPMAAIEMGFGILRQRASDAALIRVIERMDSSARRMSRMIEQILDLTRSRLAGAIEIQPAPMDLGTTLATIAEELRAAHPMRAIDLQSTQLPGSWDRDRLEQVLSNLIGNALAYGEPTLPVAVKAWEDGGLVRVEVHNHGPPIPEELQPKLFDPFRRGEKESRASNTAGLGLGLYISREIVLAHGGSLDFESNPVDGTTFRVRLPGSTRVHQAE